MAEETKQIAENTNYLTTIIVPLLSGVVGGILTTFLTFLFNRRKTKAEILKLEAETEKILIEVSNLKGNISANVAYELSQTKEKIIYQSSGRKIGHDFNGQETYVFKRIDEKDVAVGGKASGNLTIEKDEILNIQRKNIDGRYEIWLSTYFFDEKEQDSITKNEIAEGKRNFRLSFEAKVIGGEHDIQVVFKDEKNNSWLQTSINNIKSENWTKFDSYFEISPNDECRVRLDDINVSKAPSSVQIRNLVLTEKAP